MLGSVVVVGGAVVVVGGTVVGGTVVGGGAEVNVLGPTVVSARSAVMPALGIVRCIALTSNCPPLVDW